MSLCTWLPLLAAVQKTGNSLKITVLEKAILDNRSHYSSLRPKRLGHLRMFLLSSGKIEVRGRGLEGWEEWRGGRREGQGGSKGVGEKEEDGREGEGKGEEKEKNKLICLTGDKNFLEELQRKNIEIIKRLSGNGLILNYWKIFNFLIYGVLCVCHHD